MKVAGIRTRWCRVSEAMIKILAFILKEIGSLRNTIFPLLPRGSVPQPLPVSFVALLKFCHYFTSLFT